MKKKPEDTEKGANEAESVDEGKSSTKKRFCVKCKLELASDNKLPFCPACWEDVKKMGGGALAGAVAIASFVARKYGPKVSKMVMQFLLKK